MAGLKYSLHELSLILELHRHQGFVPRDKCGNKTIRVNVWHCPCHWATRRGLQSYLILSSFNGLRGWKAEGVESHCLPSNWGNPEFPGKTVQFRELKKVEVVKGAKNWHQHWCLLNLCLSIFLREVNCVKNNVYQYKTKGVFLSWFTNRNIFPFMSFHYLCFSFQMWLIRSFGK